MAAPILTEWQDAACRALDVLAANWEQSDVKALQTVLDRLKEIELDGSGAGQSEDLWVFTQLARGSTELSAMLIDALQ